MSNPRSRILQVVVLAAAMLTAGACGGGDAGGGGASASAVPVQEKVTVTPDTAATPFALAKGTYRVTWTATDCAKIGLTLTGDNGFEKSKSSTMPKFSWIVTSVTAGTYTITQTEAACTAWELFIEKIG